MIGTAKARSQEENSSTDRRALNIHQPTSNIEHPRAEHRAIIGCWALDVDCWMFPGLIMLTSEPQRGCTRPPFAPATLPFLYLHSGESLALIARRDGGVSVE